jgi:ABC-type nitrate/sulfonate/bicarbonate transport system substrate-binding protein
MVSVAEANSRQRSEEFTFMKKLVGSAMVLLAAAALSATASAQTKKLEVIVFPGGHNLALWAAQENGAFAREGLELNVTPTPSSEFQLTNLHAGKFDIGLTALDNVIAYQEGQGPVKLENPDFFAFMGGDHGFLAFVTVPEIKDFASLKGKELSVDALSTGYAFVLRRILEKNGIGFNDVRFVRAGGARERWTALEKKEHAGTMLITPQDIVAQAKGFNVLARATETLGAYQGLVGAAKRSWAKQNEAAVVGFIRGYRAGIDWAYDRGNKAKAVAILRARMPQMDERAAEATYGALFADKGGFFRDAGLDLAGVKTVLELRSAYAEPKKTLTDASKYIDLSYYEKASKK